MEDSIDQAYYDGIIERFDEIEKNVSSLMNKYLLFRNDNIALKKRISVLENENALLREKRSTTVERLKSMLDRFEDTDI